MHGEGGPTPRLRLRTLKEPEEPKKEEGGLNRVRFLRLSQDDDDGDAIVVVGAAEAAANVTTSAAAAAAEGGGLVVHSSGYHKLPAGTYSVAVG